MANIPDNQSVYDEIGGREAVDAVVSDFYDRILADEQVAHFFEGFDMAELHTHQVQFISSVAGGPVSYTGEEMREAHAPFAIEEEDFDAVAAHLDDALRENDVRDENVEVIMTEVAALEDPILIGSCESTYRRKTSPMATVDGNYLRITLSVPRKAG